MNDKAKFHGEATVREEFGVNFEGKTNKFSAEHIAQFAADNIGGKVVRRVVSTSQWVEVDA